MKKKNEKDPFFFCQKVQGGFIFETFDGCRKIRTVNNEVDAITVFVAMIHGEKLNKIKI